VKICGENKNNPMKIVKILFALLFLLQLEAINAQDQTEYILSNSTIHLETGEGQTKKSYTGYYVSFELTKDKVPYSGIIVNKEIVKNADSIKLFLKVEPNSKSEFKDTYVLTIPNNPEYIIQNDENEMVIINFGRIHATLIEKGITTKEVFITEEYFTKFKIPLMKNETIVLKKMWEKSIER
jgi:hypothetical protein